MLRVVISTCESFSHTTWFYVLQSTCWGRNNYPNSWNVKSFIMSLISVLQQQKKKSTVMRSRMCQV